MTEPDAAVFWESRYAGGDRIWSGRPNQAVVKTLNSLDPGRALDLGCGEGGDSVWLAERGWQVTAVDIAPAALARAKALADARGLSGGQITWLVEDLSSWQPTTCDYELVAACFLHSPIDFPRTSVLQRAAAAVAPGGYLLIVGHAEAPPWAWAQGHADHHFPSPTEELSTLQLDDANWETVIGEVLPREATGPDGQAATLHDTVVFVSRH
jgi:SAM-dependent methyltransferase